MSITLEQLQGLDGHGKVVTEHGDKVGAIGQVYLDDTTGTPSWVTVKTGLFGAAETFVPIESARVDGHDVVVSYSKELIKDAPRIDADGSLSPAEEDILYRHYGLGDSANSTLPSNGQDRSGGWNGTADVPSDLDDPSEAGDHRPDQSDRTVGYDRSGPTTDDAMTRSEERLHVDTEQREAGRARLRKYVVSETVTQTVPVRHEEARLEREPITDANRDAAMSGPAFSEEEHEVILHAETPVVEKTAVPVERIRVGTATVTDEETVSADLRKEHIELDELGNTTTTEPGTTTGEDIQRRR